MIPNQWYAIYPAKRVRKNEVTGLRRLGMDLALFRTADGQLGCVTDRCSHRGAALSGGQVHGGCLRCPFHGLAFDAEGVCRHVPSLGRSTTQDISRYNVQQHPVREQYGIVYLWYGEGSPAETLPFFTNEIGEADVYSEFADHWDAYYSRCIENQLDVVHLPFVHATTIGRGNKTLVNGPKVLFENRILATSAENEVDIGQAPRPAEECSLHSTYLNFLFPNLWMNHISDKTRVVIYFAPVDEESTILYIRFYSKMAGMRWADTAMAQMGKLGNLVIERQDKRVVVTQRPKVSAYLSEEKLVPGDGPIVLYRRLREKLKRGEEI